MSLFLGVLVALLGLAALLAVFIRADARALANGIRLAGPLLVGSVGAVLLLLGRASMGGMLLSAALAWFGYSRKRRPVNTAAGQKSTVRTGALEMELDHDTGSLEGLVLAGRQEGRSLAELDRAEMLALFTELSVESDSRQLLETYLDGRFPGWREDLKSDTGNGQGTAPGSGPMTKQEAYQILGLETGASTADIRKAHRRLMQRLHPDLGGSTFLAARINEAKDVLLAGHG